MEVAKDEDRATEQAANLLGSGRDGARRADGGRRSEAGKRRIIAGLLLLCLVTSVLAVVFGFKSFHRCKKNENSCKFRCLSARNPSALCQCDALCEKEGSCCVDYREVCVEPAQLWTCSKFRCGEERQPHSKCSCASDCASLGDCCANYNNICAGEKSWVEEECEDIQTPQCPAGFSKPPLIVVSMDGFRASYMASYHDLLPVLSKLKKCGVSAEYMRPVYPTKTFPNHYTIVTGLYPESHGIVDNKMYDVTRNVSFSLKSDEKFSSSWYQGEPVWLTAMKNNMTTGSFFWPGSDVKIKGKYPDFYKVYNRAIPFEERVATVLNWLQLPDEKRPDLYTFYLDEPDSAGHVFGPMSSQVIVALMKVDRVLGLLMDGLKQRGLHKCVNLVALSDHGMETASCKTAAFVSSYQDKVDDIVVVQGPAARIRPMRSEYFFTCEFGLFHLHCKSPDQSMRPYLKEHLPKRFHFANNVRIERAHLYMKETWQAEIKYCYGGFHGSDNVFKNMQTVFMAYGPSLKHKSQVAPFENIEVYNLMCDLLNIDPAPNNGTHGSLNHLLKSPSHQPVFPAELSPASICSASRPDPTDDLGCTCSSLTKEKVPQKDLWNTSSKTDVRPGVMALHCPYGVPRVLQRNTNHCLLHHSDYITGFSRDTRMPLWVAYTLKNPNSVEPLSANSDWCVRADVRVQPSVSQSCSFYKDDPKLTFGYLHPPNLSSNRSTSDSQITSNIAPMFPLFRDVWEYFHKATILEYLERMNGVNVMSGPIFDENADGHYDSHSTKEEVPVPTHFFVILTSCKNSSFSPDGCQGPLTAVSFIFPHRPDRLETCSDKPDFQWVEKWAKLHVARVRDVELLTGLSFFHDRISVEETLLLKTYLETF
uniref:SMB domain-containing protein n=1 Tax=Denticeps clupeoides TaxID=299321 RepID=A0AAY4CM89_9TELE